MSIHYQITAANPNAHILDICITIDSPNENGQELTLPSWIPGSYLIRDFSKHIIGFYAETRDGTPLNSQPIKKSTWKIEPTQQPIHVFYQVYAWDLSVRGAHFDQSHAFFNGTSVFCAVEGQRDKPCTVSLNASEHSLAQNWNIATTLPIVKVNKQGFGKYQANNFKALIEYPVEMGCFMLLEFQACGIPHKVAFTGQIAEDKIDKQQLINDLIAICERELNLFSTPYPISQYLFQVMVTGDGYGGLEHLDSTALMCSRDNLPYLNDTDKTDGYLQFLELCSHEYFHTWNVKRIQPAVYQTATLSDPVYTNQLWWFEGITSFYDGLFLYQARLISEEKYLNRLAKEMTRVYRMPGRFKQSVAESSFLTWTTFYQQDENAPNAIISYYTKGSLIAIGLDLTIRAETQNKMSLSNVLLHLWTHYGKTGIGLKEGEIESVCSQVTGVPFKHFFDRFLYGTEDLPFEALFKSVGINFSLRPAINAKDTGGTLADTDKEKCELAPPLTLGANLLATTHGTVKLTHVWEHLSASVAGLSAGDEIIALDNIKTTTPAEIEKHLSRLTVEDSVLCHYFRRDELHQTTLCLQASVSDRVVLSKIEPLEKGKASDALNWFQPTTC